MSLELMMRAAARAAEAHAGQKRKEGDQPYINHLIRVAHEAAQAGLSVDAIAAALLHDIVEDTAVTERDLAREFPERVVELVRLLTQWWSDFAPIEFKEREKPKYYRAILRDPEAVQLKLLDRADNLRDMARMLPRARRWAERYYESTRQEMAQLLRACANPWVRSSYETALESLKRALGSSEISQAA